MPSALGPVALGLQAYISGKSQVHMLQLICKTFVRGQVIVVLLKHTIKFYMSHYISNRVISNVLTQIKGCIGEFKEITLQGCIHSDVAWESCSFDLFDMPLDIPLECKKAGIHGLCIPVDSFDLRCESVT